MAAIDVTKKLLIYHTLYRLNLSFSNIVTHCRVQEAALLLRIQPYVEVQVERHRMQQRAGTTEQTGVGIYLIAATLPLSYAVGLQNGQSALVQTLEAFKKRSGSITMKETATYLKVSCPVYLNKSRMDDAKCLLSTQLESIL